MDKTYPTLYARDSKGKILQWKIKVTREEDSINIVKSYGELDGGQVIKWQRNIQGVNIGKANETNPYEQACLQSESTIRRQKDRGYMSYDGLKEKFNITVPINLKHDLEMFLPKSRVDASGNVKPMKAQQYYRSNKGGKNSLGWTDPSGKIWTDRKYFYLKNPRAVKEPKSIITTFPCMIQPKINGVRCTLQIDGAEIKLLSKEGKPYDIPQVTDFSTLNSDMFEYNGDKLVLDGELYIHGEILGDIASAVNSTNLNTPRVKFILFDLAIETYTNKERWGIIRDHIKPKLEQHLNCCIEPIRTFQIINDATVQDFTDKFIKDGYEGSILRDFDGMYAFGKRPQAMTKLKRVIDKEFIIIDIVSQDIDPSKGLFVCITNTGNVFKVTPKGDDAFKRYVLDNKEDIKGKQLTCSFYEYTDGGLPYHIIDNLIRDYE